MHTCTSTPNAELRDSGGDATNPVRRLKKTVTFDFSSTNQHDIMGHMNPPSGSDNPTSSLPMQNVVDSPDQIQEALKEY